MKLVKAGAFTVSLGFLMPFMFGWLPQAFLTEALTWFFGAGLVLIAIAIPIWIVSYLRGKLW